MLKCVLGYEQGHTMILDVTIKSRNILDRLHWAEKRRLKQEYALLIRNQMRLGNYEEAKQKQFFTLEIVSWRKRLLDYDNLVGGCKQLIDAMIDENFIWDDSPKFLNLHVKQVKNTDPVRKKHKKFHNKTWIARY